MKIEKSNKVVEFTNWELLSEKKSSLYMNLCYRL